MVKIRIFLVMKKNQISLATKNDLRLVKESLRGEINAAKKGLQSELQQLSKKIDQKINDSGKGLREEMRWQIQRSEERTDEKAQKYRDQILTSVDGVMKELISEREERVLLSARVYNHEERIEKLEKVELPLSRPTPS